MLPRPKALAGDPCPASSSMALVAPASVEDPGAEFLLSMY